MPWFGLQFLIMVFSDHIHILLDITKKVNNKDADQSKQMRRLSCALGVHTPERQIFSRQGSYKK